MFSRSILRALVWLAVSASGLLAGTEIPTVDVPLACLTQAINQSALKPHAATRRCVHAGKGQDNRKSEVTTEPHFVPPNLKTCSIKGIEDSCLGG